MKNYFSILSLIFFFLLIGTAGTARAGWNPFEKDESARLQMHRAQQQKDLKEFRKSLKGKSGTEKQAAMKAFKAKQYTENKAFNEKMHQERKAELKKTIDKDPDLSESQKNQILRLYEDQHRAAVNRMDAQYRQSTEFVEKISADPALTVDQKKTVIENYFKKLNEENKKLLRR